MKKKIRSMPKFTQKFSLIYFGIIIFFVSQALSYSVDQNGKKDLKNEWLIYNQKHDTYVPFIENTGQSASSFAFFIKKNKSKGQHLFCCVQAGTSLFIEQEIVAFYDEKKCFELNIDSLYKIFKKEDLFISIYNESLRLEEYETYLVSHQNSSEQRLGKEENKLILRETNNVKNFYIIAILLFTALLGMVYTTNPKSFREYYSINKILSFKLRQDDHTKLSLFDRFTLAILFLHSSFIAFVAIVIFKLQYEVFSDLITLEYNGLTIALYDWLKLSIIIFFAIILKNLWIRMISNLMNFTEIERFHFFEFLRLSLFIYALALVSVLIVMFLSYNPSVDHYHWIVYLIASLSVIRVIFLYIKFLRVVTFKNLYLFLYLCATEIFPLLMGFKIFIWN